MMAHNWHTPGDTDLDEVEVLLARELRAALVPVPPRDEQRVQAERAAFLAAAAQAAPVARPPQHPRWLWLRRVAALAAVWLGALAGTRALAMESLPGERLYPLKLATEQGETLLYDGEARGAFIEQQRLHEVVLLLAEGQRPAHVSFQGLLYPSGDQEWMVAGLPVTLDAGQRQFAALACAEQPVQVQALVRSGEIEAITLTPTCLEVAPN